MHRNFPLSDNSIIIKNKNIKHTEKKLLSLSNMSEEIAILPPLRKI